jgi:hypothetical protein
MADPVTQPASDAEIEAALTEAQAHAESIPSLDDGGGHKVVHLPFSAPAVEPTPATEDSTAAPTTGPADRAQPPVAERPVRRSALAWIGRGLYAAVDKLLWVINWPFRSLPSGARQLIGMVAIATLVTSLSVLLLPAR